ncbi:hypothetical protein QCA50_011080 [Cerrena zonata]|uniref:Mediator of RNA polymerase II transcription subunit 10 n=1 Tax=Cerrena zonata TaxID=2478898 RepID=A0AAW0G602_9APHY
MARPGDTPAAPDSPREADSPPPEGSQGDLELELVGLANALYNLGTTVVNDLTKEKDRPGGGKQVGLRVNDVINHLATLDGMSQDVTTMIPMQVLEEVDNSRNPMTFDEGAYRESCYREPVHEWEDSCNPVISQISGRGYRSVLSRVGTIFRSLCVGRTTFAKLFIE